MRKLNHLIALLLALVMCAAITVPAASAASPATIILNNRSKTSTIQVKEGEPFGSALPVPSAPGQVFLGWYVNDGAENFVIGERVDSSTVYDRSRHGDELFAMWNYNSAPLTVNLVPQGEQLLDLAQLLDFEVRYDGGVIIETDKPYTGN